MASFFIGVAINARTSSMVIYERLLSGKRILSELLIFVKGFTFITSARTAAFKAPFKIR